MLKKERVYILALVVLCGFLFFYRLGSPPLLDPDEPRYAETAREMLESGNLMIPHFNYEPRLNKPPLKYWLSLLSYLIFGVNEFSARFPSAVFGLGAVMVTYLLGCALYASAFVGFLAGLILATSWEYLIIARAAIIDMVLCFFLLATILCFVKFEKSRKKIYLYGLWVSMGFAVLSKGPVGLIPILIFLFFCLLGKKMRLFKEIFLRSLPALLLFLILGFSWYGLIIVEVGFREAMGLFHKETLERFAKGYIHSEPFFYFIPMVLAGFMPWTVFLPWIRIDYAKEKFVVVWFLVVFLFFSLSKSKLPTYILSLFPALSLVMANFWQGLFLKTVRNGRTKISLSLFLFMLFSAVSFLWSRGFILAGYGIDINKGLGLALIFIALGSGLSILLCLKKNIKAGFAVLMAFFVILPVLLQRLFVPDLGKVRSVKALIQPVKQRVGSSDIILAYNLVKKTGLVFYSQRRVVFLKELPLLLEYLDNEKEKIFLVIKDADFSGIKDRYGFRLENRHRNYLIVSRIKEE